MMYSATQKIMRCLTKNVPMGTYRYRSGTIADGRNFHIVHIEDSCTYVFSKNKVVKRMIEHIKTKIIV